MNYHYKDNTQSEQNTAGKIFNGIYMKLKAECTLWSHDVKTHIGTLRLVINNVNAQEVREVDHWQLIDRAEWSIYVPVNWATIASDNGFLWIGDKSLSGPVLEYCPLVPWKQMLVIFESKCDNFHNGKLIWKYLVCIPLCFDLNALSHRRVNNVIECRVINHVTSRKKLRAIPSNFNRRFTTHILKRAHALSLVSLKGVSNYRQPGCLFSNSSMLTTKKPLKPPLLAMCDMCWYAPAN